MMMGSSDIELMVLKEFKQGKSKESITYSYMSNEKMNNEKLTKRQARGRIEEILLKDYLMNLQR